jgi:hypothetical protein
MEQVNQVGIDVDSEELVCAMQRSRTSSRTRRGDCAVGYSLISRRTPDLTIAPDLNSPSLFLISFWFLRQLTCPCHLGKQ